MLMVDSNSECATLMFQTLFNFLLKEYSILFLRRCCSGGMLYFFFLYNFCYLCWFICCKESERVYVNVTREGRKGEQKPKEESLMCRSVQMFSFMLSKWLSGCLNSPFVSNAWWFSWDATHFAKGSGSADLGSALAIYTLTHTTSLASQRLWNRQALVSSLGVWIAQVYPVECFQRVTSSVAWRSEIYET